MFSQASVSHSVHGTGVCMLGPSYLPTRGGNDWEVCISDPKSFRGGLGMPRGGYSRIPIPLEGTPPVLTSSGGH